MASIAEESSAASADFKSMKITAVSAHMKPVSDLQFNTEGDLFFTSAKEPGTCVWRTETGELLGVYDTKKAVAGIDVNYASTMLATAGADFVAKIWDVRTGRELASIEQDAPCRAIGFSHDDRLLFVATEKKMGQRSAIKIYNLPDTLGSSELKIKLNPTITICDKETEDYKESAEYTTVCWGPTNSTLYYAEADGQVGIHDIEQNTSHTFAFPHTKTINRMHFSPDYLTLITASSDMSSCLLDPRNVKAFQKYKSSVNVYDAAISPITDHVILVGGTTAEQVAITGTESTFYAEFYHKAHEELLGLCKLHFGTILNVRYHPSGKLFATGAVDGHVKICRLPDFALTSAPGSKPLWKHRTVMSAEEREVYDLEEGGDIEEDEEDATEEVYYNEEEEENAVAELDDI